MNIIPRKSLWLGISLALVVPSLIVFFVYGLRLSADFTEGSLLSFKLIEKPETHQEQVRENLLSFSPSKEEEKITTVDLKQATDGTFIARLRRLSPENSEALLAHLKKNLGNFELKELRDISPFYAKTFRTKAINAVLAASVVILLYITFAFRKVSRGISSWKLGLSAVVSLLQNVIIVVGVFVLLGVLYKVEIDALFITALLSIMGFSIHDTIVVFDRFRENFLHKEYHETIDDVAERSVHQTIARSINISVTALLVLIPMMVYGAPEIFYFVLALALGIIVGTYSSIFVATPLLTILQSHEKTSS